MDILDRIKKAFMKTQVVKAFLWLWNKIKNE